MSSGFEKLQEIGVQKIHEKTHISRDHAQAILDENFEDFTKIQFLGFISILERDYDIDLFDVKESGLVYFENKGSLDKDKNKVFVVLSEKKSYKKIYIVLIVLFFAIAGFYAFLISSDVSKPVTVDNSLIEDVQNNIKAVDTADENQTEAVEIEVAEPPKEEIIVKSFKVIPNAKLWVGYIDLSTYKKYQKTLTNEFELDPKKEWLLSLGHGNVSFEIDGEMREFHSKKNMRFVYKDGELREINFQEFKQLNKGRGW